MLGFAIKRGTVRSLKECKASLVWLTYRIPEYLGSMDFEILFAKRVKQPAYIADSGSVLLHRTEPALPPTSTYGLAHRGWALTTTYSYLEPANATPLY